MAKPIRKSVPSIETRNSPLPKAQSAQPARKTATHDDIARRAYEIYKAGKGGSQLDHWLQAERELRGS